MEALLTNPLVVSTIIAGITWLGNKIVGRHVDAKAAKAATAIATAATLMTQLVLTERNRPVEEIIRACKGIMAVQLAQVGIYEADRKKYQPAIDYAIATAVTKWVASHPEPTALTMPAVEKGFAVASGVITVDGSKVAA